MSTPVWQGILDLGPLQVGLRIFSGPRAESAASFKQVHICSGNPAETPSPVKQQLVCSNPDCKTHGKPLDRASVAKGHKASKTAPLLPVPDSLFAKIAPPELDTLGVGAILKAEDVDPLYFESTYYVEPDREPGSEPAYASLLAALRESGRTILTLIVLNGRPRWILFRPGPSSIIAQTLFYEREARRTQEFRTNTAIASLDLTRPLVRAFKRSKDSWVPPEDAHHDLVQAELAKLVDKSGDDPETPHKPLNTETPEKKAPTVERRRQRRADKR